MHPLTHSRALLAALCLAACQHTHPLPPDAAAALRLDPAGAPIYEGTVRRDAADPPLFRYERHVLDLDRGVRSSHRTFTPAGEPVLLHQADHSASHALVKFHEVQSQTGLVGWVDVAADGTATFQTTVNGRTRTRVEGPGDPLLVGPTLFGYVREQWDSLLDGEVHPIRFVVLDRRRSYRFALQAVDGQDGTRTFEMVPTSLLVRLALPRTTLVFDPDGTIVRYTGRVPPLEAVGRRHEPLDATVTYALAADAYR